MFLDDQSGNCSFGRMKGKNAEKRHCSRLQLYSPSDFFECSVLQSRYTETRLTAGCSETYNDETIKRTEIKLNAFL
jgi:hypothetical protein